LLENLVCTYVSELKKYKRFGRRKNGIASYCVIKERKKNWAEFSVMNCCDNEK
jgi:hypothetical protein